MSIYAGKVSSKKIAGKIGEESEKLGGLLKKIKKPVSSLSAKSRRLVKKFLPKRHYRKFEVVDIEELAKKQGLKPNLQLFAEEPIYKVIHGIERNIKIHIGKQEKHIPGCNNYIKGKSILYGTAKEAQELINEFAGKGQMKGLCKEVVDFGKVIGEDVDEVTGVGTPTTRGTIHYGKKGAHIVPTEPKSY